MIEVNGVVDGPKDPDTFTDEFLQWIESKGWIFAGGIGPYKDDDDNNG